MSVGRKWEPFKAVALFYSKMVPIVNLLINNKAHVHSGFALTLVFQTAT